MGFLIWSWCELNEKLKLEVIALKDGFKDYDEVKIDVKNNFFASELKEDNLITKLKTKGE